MKLFASLIAASDLVAPAFGGAAPWQSSFVETVHHSAPGTFGFDRLGVPPLASTAPQRRPAVTPSLGSDGQFLPLGGGTPSGRRQVGPLLATKTSQGLAELEECGWTKYDKCDFDSTRKICIQLLDDSYEALAWNDGSPTNTWDLKNAEGKLFGHEFRSTGGRSWCTDMISVAKIIASVGCENMEIRCDKSNVHWAMAFYGLQPAKNCIKKRCPEEVSAPIAPAASVFPAPAARDDSDDTPTAGETGASRLDDLRKLYGVSGSDGDDVSASAASRLEQLQQKMEQYEEESQSSKSGPEKSVLDEKRNQERTNAGGSEVDASEEAMAKLAALKAKFNPELVSFANPIQTWSQKDVIRLFSIAAAAGVVGAAVAASMTQRPSASQLSSEPMLG